MRIYLSQLLSIWVLVLSSSLLLSQTDGEEIIIGQRYKMYSDKLQEDRSYWIYLPPSYSDSTLTESYPVLYLLDGDWYFPIASGIVQYSKGSFKLPEMIIVGILNTDRIRDFTPSNADVDMFGNSIKGLDTSGGASDFREFLHDELIPLIDSNYRTNSYRTLVGHSFGGLFATETYLEKSTFFQSYIIIDPSLWWNRGELIDETQSIASQNELNRVLIFLGQADNKVISSVDNSPHIKAIEQFDGILKSSPELRGKYQSEYFEGETHASVGIPCLYEGLAYIFDGYRPADSVFSKHNLIEAHYEQLSEKWQGSFLPPEGLIRNLGYGAQYGEKDYEKAISFFELNIKHYPQSSNAYKVLGEAYLMKGDKDLGLLYLKKALELNPEDQTLKEKIILEIKDND